MAISVRMPDGVRFPWVGGVPISGLVMGETGSLARHFGVPEAYATPPDDGMQSAFVPA